MYQNIVTDKPQTYSHYLVIGEYETLEEAEKNYKADVRKWTDENKGTMAYKLGYPFGFATIKGNWTMDLFENGRRVDLNGKYFSK